MRHRPVRAGEMDRVAVGMRALERPCMFQRLLARRVADATGGARLRLGIEAVGGSATDRLAGCLGEGGLLVNYGLLSGEPCQVSAQSFIFRDMTLRGFWLAAWFRKAPPARRMAVLGEVAALIASGALKAAVHATYDVAEIKQAVAAAAAGERAGKILVVPRVD